MKTKSLRILLLSLAALFLLAPVTSAAQSDNGKGKSFLWRVQSGTGIVYLFGSVHMAKPDSYPLPRQVEEGFAAADILAVEADPGKEMGEEIQQRLVLSAIYPANDSLQQHLSKETYDLAAAEMERVGIPIEQFFKSKPWFLAMTIEVLELLQLGYRPENGIDRYFADKARGIKEIVELESFDYQIGLLNSFSDKEQELFLLYTLKDLETMKGGMDELMQAWRTGDAKGIEKIVSRALSEYPETKPIYDKLYYQRNREMTDRVEQFLKSGKSCFVVVGAAHLVGREGIIELLKRKGYRVEQL